MNRKLVGTGLGCYHPERGEPPLTPPKEGDEELPLLNFLVISTLGEICLFEGISPPSSSK